MSQVEQKLYSFRDGMPTGPDVTLLMKRWPDPKIDDRFLYEEIEEVLGIKRDTNRWKSVTDAWRRQLRDRGLIIAADIGKAFFVKNAEQILGSGYSAFRHIGRTARNQRFELSTIKPIDESQRSRIEHQGRLFNVMEAEAKKSRMNILPPSKVEQRPQIQPPQRKI